MPYLNELKKNSAFLPSRYFDRSTECVSKNIFQKYFHSDLIDIDFTPVDPETLLKKADKQLLFNYSWFILTGYMFDVFDFCLPTTFSYLNFQGRVNFYLVYRQILIKQVV